MDRSGEVLARGEAFVRAFTHREVYPLTWRRKGLMYNAAMRAAWGILVLGAALLAWCFAGLGRGEIFAVRDAAHYYYPLLQYTQAEWRAGRIPLWNPYQDLGVPLAAGGTAAAFYPPLLLVVLAPSFEVGYCTYVLGHMVLATLSAWRLARHWRASTTGAAVAGVSYAFSGSVLFQYANVVYLVGAAWLPLALWAGERLGDGRWRASMGLALALALMVLGGDPQAAYHAVLWIAARMLWFPDPAAGPTGSSCGSHPADAPPPLSPGEASRLSARSGGAQRWSWRGRLIGLGASLGMAAGLAAVQILPSAEFAFRSQRAQGPIGSLWELPAAWRQAQMRAWANAFLACGIRPGSHRQHMYQYSLGPWRLAELVWPNCGGRAFPQHRRWFEALPAEGAWWVPSLYMGLLPLVLALGTMRFVRGEFRLRWLSWMTVLFAAGSLGAYGCGWVWNELRAAGGGDPHLPGPVGPPFGGVYWAMTAVLPGYGAFRYPAKLFAVATLGLAMLAAAGWDHALGAGRPALRKWLFGLALASTLGAVAAMMAKPAWDRWLAGLADSPLFGSLDVQGALRDLITGLGYTAAVAALAYRLLAAASQRPWARCVPSMLAILVAIDVGVANGWMVATAPANLWHTPPALAETIQRHAERRGRAGPLRVFRRPAWTPDAWRKTPSPRRLAEIVAWNHESLQPMHHLGVPLALAQVPDAMNLADYRMLLTASRLEAGRKHPTLLAQQELLDALGAAYVILAESEVLEDGERLRPANGTGGCEGTGVWYNADALERAWIVHRVAVLEPLRSATPQTMLARTRQVLRAARQPGGLRNVAVVEAKPDEVAALDALSAGLASPPQSRLPPQQADHAEICRIVRYRPGQVEIEAQLYCPGLVVLADQFYPGWVLEVATDGGPPRRWPVLRTNRVMRGAWLPAGRHRLIYRYRPGTFLVGATVSGLAWAAWAVAAGWRLARGRRLHSKSRQHRAENCATRPAP